MHSGCVSGSEENLDIKGASKTPKILLNPIKRDAVGAVVVAIAVVVLMAVVSGSDTTGGHGHAH